MTTKTTTKKTKKAATPKQLRCNDNFTMPGIGNFEKGAVYDVAPDESTRYGVVPESLAAQFIEQGKFSEAKSAPTSKDKGDDEASQQGAED